MDVLLNIDQRLLLFINSLHSQFSNTLMVFLSGQIIWIPIVLFFIISAYRQYPRPKWIIFILFLALVIIASDVSSSYILKNTFKRLRPCKLEDLKLLLNQFGQKCGGRYGFVSSHAANSIGLVIFSLGCLSYKKKWYVLFWLMPILVGYSRVYLGVHYPGDILGGAIVGSFWAVLMLFIFQQYYGANREITQ